jgi:hypothetical protein
MNLINKTSHDVNYICEDGKVLTLIPQLPTPRVSEASKELCTLVSQETNIKLVQKVYGNVVDLPPIKADTYYIVSAMVKNAINRPDLLVPADFVRSDKGVILGCKSFAI